VVTWISVGVTVSAIIIFAVVLLGTLGRLPTFQAAARDLRQRQQDVAKTQAALAGMQVEIARVQQQAERTQQHVAAMRATRHVTSENS
jgi:hypothetical protein